MLRDAQKNTRTMLEHPEIDLLEWCFFFRAKLQDLVSSSFSQESFPFLLVSFWSFNATGILSKIQVSDFEISIHLRILVPIILDHSARKRSFEAATAFFLLWRTWKTLNFNEKQQKHKILKMV